MSEKISQQINYFQKNVRVLTFANLLTKSIRWEKSVKYIVRYVELGKNENIVLKICQQRLF